MAKTLKIIKTSTITTLVIAFLLSIVSLLVMLGATYYYNSIGYENISAVTFKLAFFCGLAAVASGALTAYLTSTRDVAITEYEG